MTPQKILAVQNFVGIFQKFLDFFYSNSEKNIIFRNRFSRKILLNDYDFWQFSTHPWYVRVCGKLQNQTEKEFLGPNEASPEYFPGTCYIDIYLDLASPLVYIGRIPVNCQ